MKFGRCIAGALVLVALGSVSVNADGGTPPRLYRYLHPPPALARTNRQPSAGAKTEKADAHGSTKGFILFTGDGQAGLGTHDDTLLVSRPATTLRVTITPINPPAPLPKHLTLDGNVYRYIAVGVPGGKPAQIKQTVGVVIRWPKTPGALYVYQGKTWHRACGPPAWYISAGVTYCNLRYLGTFAYSVQTTAKQ